MTGSTSGGVATAAGLEFQYRCALDSALEILEQNRVGAIFESENPAADIIDYSISDAGGRFLLVAQAKASVDTIDGRALAFGEAAAILAALVKVDSERYELRTNRELSRATRALSEVLPLLWAADAVERIELALASKGAHESSRRRLTELSSAELTRLSRCRIVVSEAGTPDNMDRLVHRIATIRRSQGQGVGAESGEILTGALMAKVLALSSKPSGRTLRADELLRLVCPDETEVARALGRFDWNLISGSIPSSPVIGRAAEIGDLVSRLPFSDRRQTPRRVVVTGLSGLGKSTLAAAFARRADSGYDRILWIDASSTASVRDGIRGILRIAVDEDLSDSELAARLDAVVSSDVARWLIVFDAAQSARELAAWIPRTGIIDILATSTDSTAWSSWNRMDLDPVSEEDGVRIVSARLGVAGVEDERNARLLVRELGGWPLAIELACAFLAAAQRGLSMTDEYLSQLRHRISADPSLVPEQYTAHSTLIAAIDHAIDEVSSGNPGASVSPVRVLRALAFLPDQFADCWFAVAVAKSDFGPEGEHAEDAATPDISEFDVDDVTKALRSASLVTRAPALSGDVFRTNSLVLEILRARMPAGAAREILSGAQIVAFCIVKDDLDARRFERFPQYLPSIREMLHHASVHEAVHPWSIPLSGNIATSLTAMSNYHAAAEWYEQELMILDDLGDTESLLRLKTLIGLVTIELHLSRPLAGLMERLEEGVMILAKPNARARLNESAESEMVADNIIENLRGASIRGFEDPEVAPRILALENALRASGVGESPRRRILARLRDLLGDVEGDRPALDLIAQSRHAHQWTVEERLDIMELEFDALANLAMYDDAETVLDELRRELLIRGLGDQAFVQRVLNTWAASTQQLLTAQTTPELIRFVAHLTSRLPREIVFDPADGKKMLIARAAEIALSGPLDELERCLEGFDELGAVHSNLIQPRGDRVPHLIADACRSIVLVRRSSRDASIMPVDVIGLAQNNSSAGLVLPLPRLVVRTPAPIRRSSSPSATVQETREGIGIALGGDGEPILWIYRDLAGWISLDERGASLEASQGWAVASRLLGEARRAQTSLFVRVFPQGDETKAFDVTVGPSSSGSRSPLFG